MEPSQKAKIPFKAIEESETYRIIRLKGVYDLSMAEEMNAFIKNFRGQKDFEFKHIVLDFAEATFVDSSAVATIIKTMSDYKKSHHKMGMINLEEGSRNRSLLEVYHVDKLVIIYSSEADAVKDMTVA